MARNTQKTSRYVIFQIILKSLIIVHKLSKQTSTMSRRFLDPPSVYYVWFVLLFPYWIEVFRTNLENVSHCHRRTTKTNFHQIFFRMVIPEYHSSYRRSITDQTSIVHHRWSCHRSTLSWTNLYMDTSGMCNRPKNWSLHEFLWIIVS